jgi:hypothetical protein
MIRSGVLLLLCCIAAPATASAQWYVGFYLGANNTTRADITLELPDRNTSLTYEDVAFEAKPFESPQYYGYRVGRMFGEGRRFGIEGELIHLKTIAKVADAYPVSGVESGVAVDEVSRMSNRVQRYQMTHGLNFVLVNLVVRRPIANGRVALVGRAGAGPTLPHAETTIATVTREQYEYGGLGVQLAGGIEVALGSRFHALAEYKFTRARPEIDVDGGTGRMTARCHQFAFGLAIRLSR